MKTPDLHPYDEREVAFLRGEPMDGDFGDNWEQNLHGYECDCEACQECDGVESYQYVYSPRPLWLVFLEGCAIGAVIGTAFVVAFWAVVLGWLN